MSKSNNIKEFLRICIVFISLYCFNYFSFSNFLVSKGNFIYFLQSISEDFNRFLFLTFKEENLFNVFLILITTVVVLLVVLSKEFSSPSIIKLNMLKKYLFLLQKTTLGTVFVFYFIRVFNLSRFYLIIYLFILPLIFIIFESEGVVSKYLLRQNYEIKYLIINYKESKYNEIIFGKYFKKKNLVYELNKKTLLDLNQELMSLQKKYQYDFLIFNTQSVDEDITTSLQQITKIKKPIYLITEYPIPSNLIRKLVIKKIDESFYNLYFLNPTVQAGASLLFKRILDILLSILILTTLSPFIFFIALFIFFQDKKNPFVSIPRSGIYGNNFKMYKFRTMKLNAHSERKILDDNNLRNGPLFKIENDPRIISKLNWIRKYSLDEIPQFFNVLKGEMSIVGPRPLFEEDLVYFKDEEVIRLSVLPGITGLLQINMRETDDFKIWFKYDKQYIENWSIWLDIKIILLTPFRIKSSI